MLGLGWPAPPVPRASHLINQHQRVLCLGLLQALDDLPRHGPHIGTPVGRQPWCRPARGAEPHLEAALGLTQVPPASTWPGTAGSHAPPSPLGIFTGQLAGRGPTLGPRLSKADRAQVPPQGMKGDRRGSKQTRLGQGMRAGSPVSRSSKEALGREWARATVGLRQKGGLGCWDKILSKAGAQEGQAGLEHCTRAAPEPLA